MVLNGDCSVLVVLAGQANVSNVINGEFGVFQKLSDAHAYEGETEVTPSQEVQILRTKGKVVNDNITINPIPSNYGRITWNGVCLTVE